MPISRIARMNIIQTMKRESISWSGNLNNVEFLTRLYDLESLPSFDSRFKTSYFDITTHTVSFDDWDHDWIFTDSRFDLMNCEDLTFLKFLCETIHPVVRPNADESKKLLDVYNYELVSEGYKITKKNSDFGKILYIAEGISSATISALEEIQKIDILSKQHVQLQITRMKANVESDPELVIGTAKEFVETISKTILEKLNISFEADTAIHKLVRLVVETLNPLKLKENDTQMLELQRKFSGAITTVVISLAELRNTQGTGHGKIAEHLPISPEAALLAVNSASTIGLFLIQAYEKYDLK
jgi:hypothetical protein